MLQQGRGFVGERDQEGRRWILGGGVVFIECRGGEGFGQ